MAKAQGSVAWASSVIGGVFGGASGGSDAHPDARATNSDAPTGKRVTGLQGSEDGGRSERAGPSKGRTGARNIRSGAGWRHPGSGSQESPTTAIPLIGEPR